MPRLEAPQGVEQLAKPDASQALRTDATAATQGEHSKAHAAAHANDQSNLQRAGFPSDSHLLAQLSQPEQNGTKSGPSESAVKDQATGGDKSSSQKIASPVTDINGKVCKEQPHEGEVPKYQSEKDKGCQYSEDDADVAAYKEESAHAVQIKTNTGGKKPLENSGSGTIVSKDGDVCNVLVDNHEIYDETHVHPHVGVIMPNGKDYPAEPGAANKGKDLYLLRVHTGDDPVACNPATIGSSQPKLGDPISMTGFPELSETPYLSTGAYIKQDRLGDIKRHLFPDEDPDLMMGRGLYAHRNNFSGSAVYADGKMIGVHNMAQGPRGWFTPINQNDVDDLIEKSKHRK